MAVIRIVYRFSSYAICDITMQFLQNRCKIALMIHILCNLVAQIRAYCYEKKIVIISTSILTVLMMLITAFAVPSATASPISVSQNSKITTEVGPTTDLGGGDHFYVKFGSDAAFGILWGTNSNSQQYLLRVLHFQISGLSQRQRT